MIMGFYNTCVADVVCQDCKHIFLANMQFKWGAIILANYKIGDVIAWEQSEIKALVKKANQPELMVDSGIVKGTREAWLLYESRIHCPYCRRLCPNKFSPVLLEFKNQIFVGVHSCLTDVQAHFFLNQIVSEQLCLAVAEQIPARAEQVARVAVFNEQLIEYLCSWPGGDLNALFLRSLGFLATLWANELARPHPTWGCLNDGLVNKIKNNIIRCSKQKNSSLANEAKSMIIKIEQAEAMSRLRKQCG